MKRSVSISYLRVISSWVFSREGSPCDTIFPAISGSMKSSVSLLMLLVPLLAISVSSCRKQEKAPEPQHVFLISLDALRADHLGCYGYDRPTSPFLDEFGAQGIRYSKAVCNTHGTPPSHTTMLSSLYQETHRVGYGGGTPQGQNNCIPEQVQLLPEILHNHGWMTVGVTGGGYMSAVFGFFRGFDDFSDRARSVEQGASMIFEKITGAMESGKPVFAMLHTYEIHSPYEPPEEYREFFGTFHGKISATSDALLPIAAKAKKVLSREDFDYLESQYDGEIRYTDEVLKSLFVRLKESGFLENALVIITADHGEEFGDHGGLLHRGTLYEELVHIPLFVSGPMVEKGIVDPRMVGLIDITPTILDLAGIKKTPIMEGQSLLSRPSIHQWNHQRSFMQYTSVLYALRTPRWKLVEHTTAKNDAARWRLFDLRKNPAESRNVFAKFPEIGKSLAGELDIWKSRRPKLDIPEDRPHHVSRTVLDQLSALGYVEK